MKEPEPGKIVFWKPDPKVPLLKIHDPNNKPIVSIARDGTVTVHQEGGDKLAAKIFWDSLQVCGQTQEQRIKAARSHASALAAAISRYLEARLKPDQSALSVTGLCSALNDYLDFTGTPNKERNLTASRGRND